MKKISVLIIAIIAAISFTGTAKANLITNGDFEAGNTGFTSDYTYDSSSLGAAQIYTITTDPNLNHSAATSYGDHTTGSGLMMAFNGATTVDQIVWSQDVTLQANTDYQFSIFISSWYSANLANLEFSLNTGAVSLGSFSAPATTGTWEEYSVIFNSGVLSGLTTLSFIDNTLDGFGNDFAIDDISLSALSYPVPEPSTLLLLGSGLVGLGLVRRRLKA